MQYCGRHFTASEIELIRELIALSPPLSRYRLSREVCERVNWRRADGKLKDMSCRVALLRMQADDLLTLPPPRNAKPIAYRAHPDIERAVLAPTTAPSVDLARLRADLVVKKRDSLLWNAYIQRHHYLGHQLLPGAQLRYFVRAAGEIVALLGFGASAWKTKPRDAAIGWTSEQRRRNLHHAFAVRGDCAGARLAVVDDVITTGSTAAALAQALREAGAAQVEVWAVARTL